MRFVRKRLVVDGDPLLFGEVFVEVESPVRLFCAGIDRRVDTDPDRLLPVLEGEGVDREVVEARPLDRHDHRRDGCRGEKVAQAPGPEGHGDQDEYGKDSFPHSIRGEQGCRLFPL